MTLFFLFSRRVAPLGLAALIAVLAATVSENAMGRPVLVLMDVADAAASPAAFGYRVAGVRVGPSIRFSVDLDRNASAALQEATVFFAIPDQPKIAVRTAVAPDRLKHLSFTVPERLLRQGMLQVRSAPLREQDQVPNFYAYRLRLDNVVR